MIIDLEITADERAAARALCEAATPGPWDNDTAPWMVTSQEYDIAHAEAPLDAKFIAAARMLVPRLLDALDKAASLIKEASATDATAATKTRLIS